MGDERPQGSGAYAPKPCRCVSLGNFQPPFPRSIQPALTIATVVLDGTSDADKRDRIVERQRMLGAHLFGEILPPDIMSQMQPEWRDRIQRASPSFSPRGLGRQPAVVRRRRMPESAV